MRIRITFSKSSAMRYTGHLDLFRSWERVFRRSGLPLAYSLGFHPQPRLNLACALPLGFTSECEVIDAWLEQAFPIAHIHDAIASALPPGLEILSAEVIDDHTPGLQTQVASAVYVITFLDDILDLDDRLHKIIIAKELPRTRRGKKYDLRPLIEDLVPESQSKTGNRRLRVQLAAREAATGRPEELLDEMGICFADTHVHREKLIFY